ncbi:MAG: carcinine hydrolase/isopenicillin-N N-acyltransferase family protein [Eubacteriales bacterium]|nr:carcinine hydrolase/isopenicillin-N N-acyltransferase family protein [Eubacteriales bacterium]
MLYPENGLTYHTNHFLSQGHLLYGRKGSSVNRYNTIKRLLSGKEKIGIADMISVLNCTFGAPESVLNQRNSRDKEIEQCATLACFIIDATERRFWVRKGNIRENPFVEYKWSRPDKIYAEWR